MVRRKTIQKEPFDQTTYDKLCEDFDTPENYTLKEIKNILTVTKNFKFFNVLDYILLTTAALILLIQVLSYFDSISWQLSSLGRILLIKCLPIYDWRHMKNKQCFIEQFKSNTDTGNSYLNCDLCENVKKIDVYEHLNEDILEERYIDLDVPVILTKGLEFWPKNSQFIEDLLQDGDFGSSYPCKLSSNIFKGLGSAKEILQKVQHFDQYFLHFQNCEHDAMRVLRRFTFKPPILPTKYAPVTYNWLIWNKNYNTTSYKPVDLVEKFTVYGQVFGSTYVKLLPRNNCENVCSVLEMRIFEGEILILSSLWDLEYRPYEAGENMAVILEIRD